MKVKTTCYTVLFVNYVLCGADLQVDKMSELWVLTIEEGRERQVTSYLRQWTQLIRLHGWGVAPEQPYFCPEMWLYWQDYSRPCSLIS